MQPQLRHFCTHALDDLIQYINTMKRTGAYETYGREAVRWLRQSVKFAFDEEEAHSVPEELAKQWLCDDPKLPFEFIAIEMTGEHEDHHQEIFDNVYVCANLNVISKEIYAPIQEDLDLIDDSQGFLIWPIQRPKSSSTVIGKGASDRRWYPAPVMAIILPRVEMDRWENMAHHSQKHCISGKPDEPFLMVQHLVDYEMTQESLVNHMADNEFTPDGQSFIDSMNAQQMHETIVRLMEDFGKTLVGDCKTVASMCTLLECSNVVYRIHPAPRKLNLKRKKKHKEPFFEYKTLVIDPHKPRVVGPVLGPHRLRKSPKLHLRRGHIRRLRSGGKTWVSPAMIGSKRRGMILKDYDIREEEHHEKHHRQTTT